MEVFPDLHHKMSKKIAQLTKVIYHLNTKNEDHQTEIDVMSSNHQMEIQQILRDAAARIGKFKEVIESKQATVSQLVLRLSIKLLYPSRFSTILVSFLAQSGCKGRETSEKARCREAGGNPGIYQLQD